MPTQVPPWMRLEADRAQFDGDGTFLTPEERGDLFVLEYARLFREWDEYSGLLQAVQANAYAGNSDVLGSLDIPDLLGIDIEGQATDETRRKIETVANEAGPAAVSSLFYGRIAEDLEGGFGKQLKEKFSGLFSVIVHQDVAVTAVHEPSAINQVYHSGRPIKKVESAKGYVQFRTILQPEDPHTRDESGIEGAGELWLSKYLSSKEYLVYPLVDNDYNATVDLTLK